MSESPSDRASSVPDLSMHMTAEESRINVTRRKRGYNDEISREFEEFTDKLTTLLNEWKKDFRQDIKQINGTLGKMNENTQELKTEIASIRKEYSEIKKSIQTIEDRQAKVEDRLTVLEKSVQYHSDQYDDVTKKMEKQSIDIKDMVHLKSELAEIKTQNRKLRSAMNTNEQRDRLLNVEIVGIPERKEENLSEIILNIGKLTEINIKQEDIIHVNRVTPKVKAQGRPRNIIAKLHTRQLKDNIISQARKCRLSTKDLKIEGNDVPIFVNEHLTTTNKDILKKCKEIAKIKQYQFTWTKNGRIYVRKAVITPAVYIMDEKDLKKIV